MNDVLKTLVNDVKFSRNKHAYLKDILVCNYLWKLQVFLFTTYKQ